MAWLIVGLTVLLSACGQDDSHRAQSTRQSPAAAESVSVLQTGGIAGDHTTTTVVAGSPGADAVLARAGRLAERGGETDVGTHQPACCDLFAYTITIETSAGSTVRVRTWDGDRSPAYDLARSVLALDAPATATR